MLYGVDRAVDPERLAGLQSRAVSSVSRSIIDMVYEIGREGGIPDLCCLHPHDYAKLAAEIGFTTATPSVLQLATIVGRVECYPTAGVLKDEFYVLQRNTWKWHDEFGGYCTAPALNGKVTK